MKMTLLGLRVRTPVYWKETQELKRFVIFVTSVLFPLQIAIYPIFRFYSDKILNFAIFRHIDNFLLKNNQFVLDRCEQLSFFSDKSCSIYKSLMIFTALYAPVISFFYIFAFYKGFKKLKQKPQVDRFSLRFVIIDFFGLILLIYVLYVKEIELFTSKYIGMGIIFSDNIFPFISLISTLLIGIFLAAPGVYLIKLVHQKFRHAVLKD